MAPYQISRDGQMLGEFVESQIHEGMQTGYFQPTDWCWREGMGEWMGLGAVFRPLAPAPQPQTRPVPRAATPYAAPRSGGGRVAAVPRRIFAEPASLGARFGAVMLDKLALVACLVPAAFMSSGQSTTEGDKTLLMIIGLLILAVFLTNLMLIAMSGQTIGKKMVGIQISDVEGGGKAGFFQILFLRTFVAQGLLYMVPLYNLVDICYIFSQDRRCLHDKIAGTQVLNVA